MGSVGASAVLGADVTMNPGASMTPFMELPFPAPTVGPAQRPTLEQHLPTLNTRSFPPDRPLLLPALPRTPLVAGNAGQGLGGTGAFNIMDQVRSEEGQPQPPKTQTIVLTQAPSNWNAPGASYEGVVCPAPLFLEASVVEMIMPGSAFGGTQASHGGWCPGHPPQAPPPTAQLAPIIAPVNAGPRQYRVSREGGLATTQSKASPDDSCNPKTRYEDFRRWQCFKALARGHLPQSPDAEALACFLLPVLRSLSRLKPTMTLEEGIGQAMQEWQRKSNFDRMTYYDIAAKFMEFEAEEEMQIQKLQLMEGVQGQPISDTPRPDPQGSPVQVVCPQPAHIPSAQCAHPLQRPGETESPNEIPPEAVQEYMDIMDHLLGPAHSASGEPGGEWKEDTKEWHEEEDALSYCYQLCSQKDFVTKVKDVINPEFVARVLSLEAGMDPLDIAEELEQEEELTTAQLVEKRLLSSKKIEDLEASPSHGAPLWDSSPSESVAGQDAQRCDLGPQLEVNDKASPPETDVKDRQRHHPVDAQLSGPKAFAVSSGHQEHPPLRAQCPPSTPQGHGRAYSGLGPRDASIPREPSVVRETRGPVHRSREDEGDLASLAFLSASPKSLLPCVLSLSPVPASGHVCPGAQGPRRAAQSRFFQTLGLSRAPPPASKSRKRALGGGPVHADKTPLPGADLGVSGRLALALGLVSSSQPQKRKSDQSVTGGWVKRHCSQDVAVGCSSHCQLPGGPRLDVTWLSPRGSKSSFSSQG